MKNRLLFVVAILASTVVIFASDTLEVKSIGGWGGYGYAFIYQKEKLKNILEIDLDNRPKEIRYKRLSIRKIEFADSVFSQILKSKVLELKDQKDLPDDFIETADGTLVTIGYKSSFKSKTIEYLNPDVHPRKEDSIVAKVWAQVWTIRDSCLHPGK